jgi:RNA polymerase sigma factor (sigma-70 family)
VSPRLPELLLTSKSDEQLVRLASAGNERAFAAIVERYGQELYRLACRMRLQGRAEDVVQQTFLSAFAALRSGTEIKHLRGWLYRILRNEVIRAHSRAVVEVELEAASVASEPLEDASQRRLLALDALSSIAALPTRQRDALVATALGGQSRAAVADSMGVSEGAVRQLMHRARASVRAAVAAVIPAPPAPWLLATRGGAGPSQAELAVGAGTASASGLALKVGAILASGVVATGIVGSQLVRHHAQRGVSPAGARSVEAAARQALAGASSGRAAGSPRRAHDGSLRAAGTAKGRTSLSAARLTGLAVGRGAHLGWSGVPNAGSHGGADGRGRSSGGPADGDGRTGGDGKSSGAHEGSSGVSSTGTGSGMDGGGSGRDGGAISAGNGSGGSGGTATTMDGGGESTTSGGGLSGSDGGGTSGGSSGSDGSDGGSSGSSGDTSGETTTTVSGSTSSATNSSDGGSSGDGGSSPSTSDGSTGG